MTITPLGGGSGGAVDASSGGTREEPKVAVEAALELTLLPKDQEPEKPKRRRDAGSVVFWVSKKPRSSVARERVDAIQVIMNGADPICNRGRQSPGGGIVGVVNEKEDQKLSSCKSHHQIDLSTGTSELASRRHRCNTAKHSDRKTTRQLFMRLSLELRRLGLTNVTPILSKILTNTDCNFNAHRLLLPRRSIWDSPLMGMLTQEEHKAVYRDGKEGGVSLKLLDQHGRSYQMKFKFLKSDQEYRLIGEWPKFVKTNGMRKGDLVDLGASRSDGCLLLTLLHHAMEGQNSEETGAAEGTEEWVSEKIEAAGSIGVEQNFADIEETESGEECTLMEMEAAKGLLTLSHMMEQS